MLHPLHINNWLLDTRLLINHKNKSSTAAPVRFNKLAGTAKGFVFINSLSRIHFEFARKKDRFIGLFIFVRMRSLLNDFVNGSRTNGTTTFTNRELRSLFNRDWVNEFNIERHVITWHNHLHICW